MKDTDLKPKWGWLALARSSDARRQVRPPVAGLNDVRRTATWESRQGETQPIIIIIPSLELPNFDRWFDPCPRIVDPGNIWKPMV